MILQLRERGGGKVLEIQITELASDGDGVGRDESGRVIFVPLTAPGDRVRVELTEERSKFARGVACEILEKSAQRTEPQCEFFGRCGGCRWQHIHYEDQLRAKATNLRDALQRLAKLEVAEEIDIEASPSPYGYRARTRVFSEGEVVGYRRYRSSELFDVPSCPILSSPVQDSLHWLARTPKRSAGEYELASGASGEGRVTQLESKKVLSGPEKIELISRGRSIEISPGGFFQGNALLWDALVEGVQQAVGQGDRLLELFAGAGFFTLAIADGYSSVVAVESNREAMADLSRNLRVSGLSHIEPVASTVEKMNIFDGVRKSNPEVVFLDPPRIGLTPLARQSIQKLRAPKIVYLSCNPASLARDLSEFSSDGYRVARVRGFDLFPQTAHLETLVELERFT